MAISVDPPAKSKELQQKLSVTFPLLSDESLATGRAYGVEDKENAITWPSLYLVAPDGKIAWRNLSQTYKVRAGPADLLKAIEALPHR